MQFVLATLSLLIFSSLKTVWSLPVNANWWKGFRTKPSLQFVIHYCDWPTPYNLTQIHPTFAVQYRGGEQTFTVSNNEQIEDMITKLRGDGVIKDRVAFIIHGYENDISSPWLNEIAEGLLAVEDYTIFVVGWGNGADFWINFGQAAANTRVVSAAVALATASLREKSLPYVYCIGHSLGAHVCGQAGLISQFDRVTGLDPAGPGFDGCPQNSGLSKESAHCVDVIHTNGASYNGYGTTAPLGHVDFYPNCGWSQPGCSFWDMFVGCSHHMAIPYFIASINAFGEQQFPSSVGPCVDTFLDQCSSCGWWSCPDEQPTCLNDSMLLQSIGYGSVCHQDKAPACCSQSSDPRDKYFGMWYVPMTTIGGFGTYCPAAE